MKQALLNAGELDTMLVMRTIGATHRVWKNAAAEKCAALESDRAELPEILNVVAGEKAKRMYREGDVDLGIILMRTGDRHGSRYSRSELTCSIE